jgi:hypothetical protein
MLPCPMPAQWLSSRFWDSAQLRLGVHFGLHGPHKTISQSVALQTPLGTISRPKGGGQADYAST